MVMYLWNNNMLVAILMNITLHDYVFMYLNVDISEFYNVDIFQSFVWTDFLCITLFVYEIP